MPITTQLNEKANVKRGSAADTLIAGRKVISLEETQTSTASQTTIIISTFAVDVSQSKNLFVIVDGKILTEGSSNDYTLTSVSPNNTSNTISLSQALPAGLNIRLLYLGVVIANPSMDTLSPAMSDWTPFVGQFDITSGTPGTKGTILIDQGYWRRVGDSMEILYTYRQTAAGTAGTSGYYTMLVPGGYSIDGNKITFGNLTISGAFYQQGLCGNGTFNYTAGRSNYWLGVGAWDSTHIIPVTSYTNSLAGLGPADGITFGGYSDFAFSFVAKIPIAGWSSNVIAQNSKVFRTADYAANGTNVTTNPANLGEYRTYNKNASALTGTDNAAAAPFLPTNADGFRIDGSVNYASAGTSGRPNRIEAFVGFNKHVTVQMYSSAGRTGAIDVDVNPDTATTYYGVSFGYDPTTGVAFADAIDQPTATTSRFAGRSIPTAGGAPADAAYLYFDWIVSDNVLPVQYSDPNKVARNEIKIYGRNGSGTGTANSGGPGGPNVPRWSTVQFSYGTAITYVDDVTYGGYFLINEPGIYSMWYTDDMTGGAQGLTLNAYQLSTNINALDPTTVLAAFNATDATASATAFLQVGDRIRAHTNGATPSGDPAYEHFHIIKIANG